jgi:hypothetical protein
MLFLFAIFAVLLLRFVACFVLLLASFCCSLVVARFEPEVGFSNSKLVFQTRSWCSKPEVGVSNPKLVFQTRRLTLCASVSLCLAWFCGGVAVGAVAVHPPRPRLHGARRLVGHATLTPYTLTLIN